MVTVLCMRQGQQKKTRKGNTSQKIVEARVETICLISGVLEFLVTLQITRGFLILRTVKKCFLHAPNLPHTQGFAHPLTPDTQFRLGDSAKSIEHVSGVIRRKVIVINTYQHHSFKWSRFVIIPRGLWGIHTQLLNDIIEDYLALLPNHEVEKSQSDENRRNFTIRFVRPLWNRLLFLRDYAVLCNLKGSGSWIRVE